MFFLFIVQQLLLIIMMMMTVVVTLQAFPLHYSPIVRLSPSMSSTLSTSISSKSTSTSTFIKMPSSSSYRHISSNGFSRIRACSIHASSSTTALLISRRRRNILEPISSFHKDFHYINNNQRQRYLFSSSSSISSTSSSSSGSGRYNNEIQQQQQASSFSTNTTNTTNLTTKKLKSQKTSSSTSSSLSFESTPLGQKGQHLLDGLDRYTVPATEDGHPIAVYGIGSINPIQHHSNYNDDDDMDADADDECSPTTTRPTPACTTTNQQRILHPILLLHGRTWSSIPVYHLLGGNHEYKKQIIQEHHYQQQQQNVEGDQDQNQDHDQHMIESRSLFEALYAQGLQPYAMDFRGFGGTPSDPTGTVEPTKCVQDTQTVLQWIAKRHGLISNNNNNNENQNVDSTTTTLSTRTSTNTKQSNTKNHPYYIVEKPALLGWSQGALIAQLMGQKPNAVQYLSKLILYASIYDPLYRYPRQPLYLNDTMSNNNNNNDNNNNGNNKNRIVYNDYNSAIEDFTVEGTIPPVPAKLFAEAALISDPIKAQWTHTYQFNTIDPGRVHVPCLVIAGDQDPYAPVHVQQMLFTQLGREADRTWSILSGCDHAVHLLDGRFRLINILTSFLTNDKRCGGSGEK